MKKILFFLCFSAASIQADEDLAPSYPQRIQSLPMGFNKAEGAILAEDWTCYFTGDFIYWRATEDNLAYGVASAKLLGSTNIPATSPFSDAKLLRADFDWHPGLKAGFGLRFDRDRWDLGFNWTHYISTSTTSSTAPRGGTIYPSLDFSLFYPFNATFHCQFAKMKFHLAYNTVDLELGRSAAMGKKLIIKPHIGGKTGWFSQFYRVNYEQIVDSNNTPFGTTTVDSSFDSWCIGPRAGLKMNWYLRERFRLIANAAVSAVFLSTNVKKSTRNQILDPQENRSKLSTKLTQYIPNIDVGIGFGWGTYFKRERYYFECSVLYEMQYWKNMNGDIRLFTTVIGPYNIGGDLSLQGATFNARLDF